MLLEFSSQKNVQDGFDRFDIPGMVFKGRIKRMLLTQSVVGSFRNQENPNGKKQVIHRFLSEAMMLNKPVAGERLTAVFSCFVSCHNEILQNGQGKKMT